MTRSTLTLLSAALVMLAPNAARAACAEQDQPPGWIWTYDGTIGDQPSRLTLVRKGAELSGVYFSAKELKDIGVSGKLSEGRQMVLDEVNAAGKVTGRFRAEFPERDPAGILRGTLHCALIGGTWQKVDAGQALPVHFSLTNGNVGTLAHMYAAAGAKDDSLVNRNALRFRQAVEQGDKAAVAALIQYPIQVRIKAVAIPIQNRAELVARYDEIFSPAFRKAITGAMPRHMFAREQGVMLGKGEAWFGATGRVIALNN